MKIGTAAQCKHFIYRQIRLARPASTARFQAASKQLTRLVPILRAKRAVQLPSYHRGMANAAGLGLICAAESEND
jgi:hypothetical protein